jgi:hypothetical protein
MPRNGSVFNGRQAKIRAFICIIFLAIFRFVWKQVWADGFHSGLLRSRSDGFHLVVHVRLGSQGALAGV